MVCIHIEFFDKKTKTEEQITRALASIRDWFKFQNITFCLKNLFLSKYFITVNKIT